MKKIILSFFTILYFTGTSTAKIGETPEQCAQRDGAVTEAAVDGSWQIYISGGILSSCMFKDNKCASTKYYHITPSSVNEPDYDIRPRFTEDQALRLLKLNSPESSWKLIKKDNRGEPWDGIYATDDGKIQALVHSFVVRVETKEKERAGKQLLEKEAMDATRSAFEKMK
jgi:hypothetical protein